MSPRPLPPGALSREETSTWARVRRYAVPRWMIERATEARLAGDWRAACDAAAVDITPGADPERAAETYGADVAARLADDLRHFAPDLLRWHLPRPLGGHTGPAPARRVALAAYGTGPVLSVTTSPMLRGPQRLRLHLGPAAAPGRDQLHGLRYGTEDWTAARRFWDARHTGELRYSAGGFGSGRLPFLHPDGTPLTPEELPTEDPGPADPAARAEWVAVLQSRGEYAEAYTLSGLDLDLTAPPLGTRSYRQLDVAALAHQDGLDLTRIVPEIRLLERAGHGTSFLVPVRWRGQLRVDVVPAAPDGTPARVTGREHNDKDSTPFLPGYAWQRLPDIALLRAGLIRPEALHPLVAAALLPQAGPATGPDGPPEPVPVRVRCRGEWHQVVSRDGRLAVPHTEQEQRREIALRAFGGAVSGCFATQHTWTSGEGRLPRALRAQQRDLFERAQHGDAPGVLALLDAGVDPHVRDAAGLTLLHVLHLLDHRELLPRLLAAGLDLEARSKTGRTPLQNAVEHRGSADLVQDLLDAGARIDGVNDRGLSLAQVIRSYERHDLMFLRRRVLKEHPGIGDEWYDAYLSERDEEPDWDEDPPFDWDDDSDGGEPEPGEDPDPPTENDWPTEEPDADGEFAPDPAAEPVSATEPDHSDDPWAPGEGRPATQHEDDRA
ncbi:ankyrin repeat domain-containing protein [Streptomyces sp. LaPpAH-108]|uniref:ankyrin repeat domain-containing protein n=1 Tax=Streptomyces sp. LaPpAH-108 TaxID=1155714 RepID=UPI0003A2F016|nr:ankyrin repeat domain-containing protein [Streptomyces sp. LaPpAH-108]